MSHQLIDYPMEEFVLNLPIHPKQITDNLLVYHRNSMEHRLKTQRLLILSDISKTNNSTLLPFRTSPNPTDITMVKITLHLTLINDIFQTIHQHLSDQNNESLGMIIIERKKSPPPPHLFFFIP